MLKTRFSWLKARTSGHLLFSVSTWKTRSSGRPLLNASTWNRVIWVCTRPGRRPRCKISAPVPPLPQLSSQDKLLNQSENSLILGAKERCQFIYFSPDIYQRIGLASSTMGQLDRAWCNKLRHYLTCITPVLLCDSETWTAFYMRYQRRILGVKWHNFVTNDSILNSTGLEDIRNTISRHQHALFLHVRRQHTCAHRAQDLHEHKMGAKLELDWKRSFGRPHNSGYIS